AERIREAAVTNNLDVYYSAYKTEDDGTPIDNLDEHPLDGEGVVVLALTNDGWTEEKTFYSEPMMNPTWLDIAAFCDRAIKNIDMGDHRFLEQVQKSTKQHDGHPVVNLWMGS
ncbi:MAG: hypothetical protein KJ556_21740, partial [Gammaproteobacteria bacterium]|nr:hypothetical protein [Gammaproteobacteria bacterium]